MNDQERIEYLKGQVSWLRIKVVDLLNNQDALAAENKRLDLLLASESDAVRNLKDELSDLLMREIDAKIKHDDLLGKYLKLKFQVEKMLINGSWYAGAIEGNPKIDFAEVEVEIKQIIEWQGSNQ